MACLLLQYQAIALAAPEVLTAQGNTADFADFRADTGGNLHLVWHDAAVDSGAIMYKMRDGSGSESITRTQVNTGGTGSASTWPAVAIDASTRLFVVWQDMNDQEVYFMRLEPLLDDRNGDAAVQATIKTAGDIRISTAGGFSAIHPRIRLDANGDVHVVWESGNGGTVEYVKLDPDGNVLNGPVSLGAVSSGNDLPDIDIDTNGNVHVVFGNPAPVMLANEVYYAMLDGTTGAVLIAPTLLTLDDGLRAGQATVNVDTFDNTLYIVFKQALANGVNGVEEIFLARLNPSLDDQDGSAADPAVLAVFQQQITNGEGRFQWHVRSRIGADKRIHATYIDFDEGGCPGAGAYSITDAHITFAGKVVARQVLTTTGSATTCFPQAHGAPGHNRIVWTDGVSGTQEIHSTIFSRAETGSSGFLACSLGRPGAIAWRSGELWLLAGLLGLLGIRHVRR